MKQTIKRRLLIGISTTLLVVGCASSAKKAPISKAVSTESPEHAVVDYVDPFIGTGGHGHTFPGALVPFGMVQLSPDNPSKGWDWTSGYHYSDDTLVGFSHTHLSGTGVGDLLDILFMPFNGDYSERDKDEKGRIFTHYSHDNEAASPGYYQLYLPDEKVNVELTATRRGGMHKYDFEEKSERQLLIDLAYAQNYDKPVVSFMRVVDENTVVGYRLSTGWARNQPVYFKAVFNQPFNYQFYDDQKAVDGHNIQAEKTQLVLNFNVNTSLPVEAKVALSYVSIEGAEANFAAELANRTFDNIRGAAELAWANQLSKFEVKDSNVKNKTKFYTALYHSFVAPQTFNDVNGDYFGADGATHNDTTFERNSLFSLWDTFRAQQPLITLSNPERVDDIVKSLLAFYDETGLLPSWDLMSNETDVMIGYHAVPVLVDAYLKGLTTADPSHIYQAIKTSAMQDKFGIDLYRQYGYIPSELELEAVSKTLEYAYDDWAIAQMAKALGKQSDYTMFSERANSYRTLFDQSTGFMRGRDADGNWVTPFNPTYVEHRKTDYTEANAWQYTFFVPHDVDGLKAIFGGESQFVAKLDELFSTSSELQGDVSPDISGLIGQYAHGNEPVHHVAYLYAFTDSKHSGEDRIREIRDTMYLAQPDGLAGNDDLGQMSAWYAFSAIGFYPMNPVGGEFVLGTPEFEEVSLSFGEQPFVVKRNTNEGTEYVKEVRLNGQLLETPIITYAQLVQGGELEFIMHDK